MAEEWQTRGGYLTLTLAADEASIRTKHRAFEGFTGFRISYDETTGRNLPRAFKLRRAFVEIDFQLLHELALLVAAKPSPDQGEVEEE